jgi:putative peptidoglycan lipid II flippase
VDGDRERELRRLERDRRRREQGKPTYFERSTESTFEGWPVMLDPSEQPTMVIRPSRLREEAARREALEEDQFTAADTMVIPPADEAEPPAAEGRRLAVSTAIFAVATGLSRVLGLVREMVAGYYFGVRGPINNFTVAFQIPNLVRALVADAALSSAFVPVFSELLEKGERKRAWRVASSLFWLMLLGLTALTALFVLVAPFVLRPFHPPNADLATGLSRVLFPIVALLGVSGIVVGILNSYDHFTVPAVSPVFWNLAIIAGLAIGVPHESTSHGKLYVYAAAILVATFIQVFLPMPWLRGRDGRLQLVLDWHDPAVREVFRNMIPVTLGLGLINVNAVIDTFFASRLIDANLAPTAIQKAFLVYMLPQGMFSVAIATVLFPSLARFAARGDMTRFRETVSRGLRQIAFLLVPAAVVSALLAEPIVRLLYQRGAWHPNQTPVVADALAAFSAGLVFNGAMLMLNRAFFSLKQNWLPTKIALANLFLNALLDLAFYRVGVWGIPLSTAVCNLAGAWALIVLLRRRVGGLEGGAITSSVLRVAIGSAFAGGIGLVLWRALDHALGRSFPAQLVSLGVPLAIAVGSYLGACRLLQVQELDVLTSLRRRRA